MLNQAIFTRSHPQSPNRDNKEKKMPKETTHRNPEKRADRIERRAKKRAGTVNRKQTVKARKARPLEDV